MRYSILFTVLICYLELTPCQPRAPQSPDQTTSRPEPPDQSCSVSNIIACTCDPSDMSNCDILQDAFDPFGYDVDCVNGLPHCTLLCQSNSDCAILSAGGYDSECDGISCVPQTSDQTTSRPQPPSNTVVFGSNSSCNSIYFKFGMRGAISAFPEHFCFGEKSDNFALSENYVCDEQGGAIMNIWYNFDCSGSPTRSEDPCEGKGYEGGGECSYTMYCGGDTCSYAVIEDWYNVTQCDGDTVADNAFGAHISHAFVLNECFNNEETSSKIVCSESGMTFVEYDGAHCTGDPLTEMYTNLTVFNGCDAGEAHAVECIQVYDTVTTTAQSSESDTTSTSTTATTNGDDATTNIVEDGGDDDDTPGSGAHCVALFVVFIYFIVN